MGPILHLNTAWISLTYECNNRCGWCYAASNFRENRGKRMPLDRALGTIDFLASLDTQKVILIGGEPTMYPGLEEVILRTKERGMGAGVISNGRKFKDSPFTQKIKESGIDYLTISVAGADAETHDGVTEVRGSFYETLGGIRTACDAGISVATNTVIASGNIGELERIVDLMIGEKITEMTFNICGVCVSQESNNSQLLPLPDAVVAFERVYVYAKSQGIRARLVTPMPICLFDSELRGELQARKLITGGPCQLIYGRNLVVEYDGSIVPCTHLAHFPLLNIFRNGNIVPRDEFLIEYNSPKGIPFTFRERMARYPSPKCDTPNCNEPCAGGCPLYWTKFDPEETIKGVKC